MGENLTGQYAAWNYFQSVDSPTNAKFIKAFKDKYGQDRVTSDPMEAAYTSMYLYKDMVEKAEVLLRRRGEQGVRRCDLRCARGHGHRQRRNHHIAKTALIGQINADNQFDIVWSSEKPIEPDPFLKGYDWWDPSKN